MASDNLLSPESLNTKVGKFPVWVWGVAGAAVVLVFYYFRSAHKAGTAAASIATQTQTPDSTAAQTFPTTGTSLGGVSNDTSNALGATSLETNASWITRGVAVSAKGGANPLTASNALNKYLAGGTLTAAEAAVVASVLATNGYPPEGTTGPAPFTNNNPVNPINVPATKKPVATTPKPVKVIPADPRNAPGSNVSTPKTTTSKVVDTVKKIVKPTTPKPVKVIPADPRNAPGSNVSTPAKPVKVIPADPRNAPGSNVSTPAKPKPNKPQVFPITVPGLTPGSLVNGKFVRATPKPTPKPTPAAPPITTVRVAGETFRSERAATPVKHK